MVKTLRAVSSLLILPWFFTPAVLAQEDLAKQSQNPLGTVISVPLENNLYFNIGPSNATAYVLNMKPVYPVNLGSVNLINRFILPAICSEGPDHKRRTGSAVALRLWRDKRPALSASVCGYK